MVGKLFLFQHVLAVFSTSQQGNYSSKAYAFLAFPLYLPCVRVSGRVEGLKGAFLAFLDLLWAFLDLS